MEKRRNYKGNAGGASASLSMRTGQNRLVWHYRPCGLRPNDYINDGAVRLATSARYCAVNLANLCIYPKACVCVQLVNAGVISPSLEPASDCSVTRAVKAYGSPNHQRGHLTFRISILACRILSIVVQVALYKRLFGLDVRTNSSVVRYRRIMRSTPIAHVHALPI